MAEPATCDLSLVLGPLSLADFMGQYWEQEPLHIERGDQDYFAPLLSAAQVESLLSSQVLRFPEVQLSCKRSPVAVAGYTDGDNRIVPHRLIEEYRKGATIVMSAAHQRIASLADLRRGVQASLALRCQTNLYLSPPLEQGFGAHYDSHDVFILQVQGSKVFNFYEGGVERPYSHEGFDASVHQPGELAQSVTVLPGDTLYIPRGVFHDAVACDSASMHITLGVYAVTLRETLLEMVDVMTQEDPRYRHSVPASLWASASAEQLTQGHAEPPHDLLTCSLQMRHWEVARQRLLNDIAMDNAQHCAGMLETVRPELLPDTVMRVKAYTPITMERQGEVVTCRLPGQVLELRSPLAEALEQLMGLKIQTLSDWATLSEDQRQALCEQLLQANVIEVGDGPGGHDGTV